MIDRMYKPKQLAGEMALDTMDPRCNALHGDFKYCQVFGNKKMFCKAYAISSKKVRVVFGSGTCFK